ALARTQSGQKEIPISELSGYVRDIGLYTKDVMETVAPLHKPAAMETFLDGYGSMLKKLTELLASVPDTDLPPADRGVADMWLKIASSDLGRYRLSREKQAGNVPDAE